MARQRVIIRMREVEVFLSHSEVRRRPSEGGKGTSYCRWKAVGQQYLLRINMQCREALENNHEKNKYETVEGLV